ncbi:hypothetical protein ACFQ3N_02340 [Virgibacillus byunsanensis]|uniref:Uncharacterized protein n=1 Tax=Virgibacillus byunsanensis TaxID=570945 RepID=A0ABW3LGL9_9BACI
MDQEAGQGTDHYRDGHANHGMDHHTDQDTDRLIKLNKDERKRNQTRQNNNITTTDAFVFYQENFEVSVHSVA